MRPRVKNGGLKKHGVRILEMKEMQKQSIKKKEIYIYIYIYTVTPLTQKKAQEIFKAIEAIAA